MNACVGCPYKSAQHRSISACVFADACCGASNRNLHTMWSHVICLNRNVGSVHADAGWFVAGGRVMGNLAMSRALGDGEVGKAYSGLGCKATSTCITCCLDASVCARFIKQTKPASGSAYFNTALFLQHTKPVLHWYKAPPARTCWVHAHRHVAEHVLGARQ